jgi:hypothetical protein
MHVKPPGLVFLATHVSFVTLLSTLSVHNFATPSGAATNCSGLGQHATDPRV